MTISLAGYSTGSLHLDDVIIAPMPVIDGIPTVVVGGATPFRLKDEFDWTDTDPGSDGTTMYWIWRTGTGINFPSATGGAETDSDPT